jgi:CheY-like chemotaxis protein/Tfp pilus assembly protein PilZ
MLAARVALKLQFVARSWLWAEVLNTEGERVFVPSNDSYRLGEGVTVDVEAPELSAPLRLTAVVQGLRPTSGRFPSGVFLKVDAASLELCRAAIGAPGEAAVRVAGRTELRVDCALSARVTSPVEVGGCTVKSLSASGLTLTGPLTLVPDAPLTVAFSLPDGRELSVHTQAVWVRGELQLAGLRILETDADLTRTLEAVVASLQALAALPARSTAAALVVVADDDPSILEFVSRTVAKAGHRVQRASRGDDTLALIRKERPSLVFLDVLMPGIDGLEVCRALLSDASLWRVPVVLLSAMGEQRLSDAANGAGADDYLLKPIQLEVLRVVLSKYLP